MSQTETTVRHGATSGHLAIAILALIPFVAIAWTVALAYLVFVFFRQFF
jgi:hypothetical protein